MRYLTDNREPLTNEDIDQAQADARRLLALQGHVALPPAGVDIIARLLAIVDYTYGPLEIPGEYRPAPERHTPC